MPIIGSFGAGSGRGFGQRGAEGAAFICATGGTITTCGDYKIHTFTSPGTFCVSCAGNPGGSDKVEYIVVAGAAGGGSGGGGAGGFRFASSSLAPLCYPAKPLSAPTDLPVTATGYPITVGGGGPGGSFTVHGSPGSNSVFSTITSAGGGYGASFGVPCSPSAGDGGSGGGGGGRANSGIGGSGNTPPVGPPQGKDGGSTLDTPVSYGGSGGGGALAVGTDSPGTTSGADGGIGAGVPSAFGTSGENCGSNYYFSGGGGGGGRVPGTCAGFGGLGGAGDGTPDATPAQAGTTNTGGGGGGGGFSPGGYGNGGNGGSGIVIIRYKYQ